MSTITNTCSGLFLAALVAATLAFLMLLVGLSCYENPNKYTRSIPLVWFLGAFLTFIVISFLLSTASRVYYEGIATVNSEIEVQINQLIDELGYEDTVLLNEDTALTVATIYPEFHDNEVVQEALETYRKNCEILSARSEKEK